MMSTRNSENHTNNPNVEQENASTAVVVIAATDTASRTIALSKQRKKRKKKRDKSSSSTNASATTSTANANRYETSCNFISSCSNCVQCACAYCKQSNSFVGNNFNYSIDNNFAPFANVDDNFVPARFYCNYNNRCATNIASNKTRNGEFIISGRWSAKNPNDIDIDASNIAVVLPTNNDSDTESFACDSNYLRSQRGQGSGNRRTEQLQRFAIYENLCEFCGFAIGTGSYHLNCPKNEQRIKCDVSSNEVRVIDNKYAQENIYENICESCHLIFSGENCTNEKCVAAASTAHSGQVVEVLMKKPPIPNRQFGKQFSELLGTFKQKLKDKSSPKSGRSTKPKIEIVHNYDQVFRTNKTFDLNEIVKLKNNSTNSVQKDNSIYGKLRTSNETITFDEPPKKCTHEQKQKRQHHETTTTNSNRIFRTSTSESNFFQQFNRSSQLQSGSFSESIASDTILYSNSYAAPPSYEDAIQNCIYASLKPFKGLSSRATKSYGSTSASSFFTFDSSSSASTLLSLSSSTTRLPTPSLIATLLTNDNESLRHWMTSLKRQTHDYCDDNDRQFEYCVSNKCVPPSSKLSFSCYAHTNEPKLQRINQQNPNNIFNNCVFNMNDDGNRDNALQANLLRRVELFKANLLEQRMLSKRNAIYFKDLANDDSLTVANFEYSALSNAVTLPPQIESETSESNILSSIVTCTYDANQSESEQCNEDDVIVCLRPKNVHLKSSLMEFTLMNGKGIRNIENNNITNDNRNSSSEQQNINQQIALATTAQYLQVLKTFYITQITLSTSLNRIVLSSACGVNERQINYLFKLFVSHFQGENSSVCEENTQKCVTPTKYINFDRLFERLHKMNIKKRLVDNDACHKPAVKCLTSGNETEKQFLNDFLMRSTNHRLIEMSVQSATDKQTIGDFEKQIRKTKRSASNRASKDVFEEGHPKRLDDFHKPIAAEVHGRNKTINDFAKKKSHYSSPTAIECEKQTATNSVESTPQDSSTQPMSESIYQPIWLFKTIGTATDDTSCDGEGDFQNSFNDFYSDETTIEDVNEWEVAEEEFLFSSNQIDAALFMNNNDDEDTQSIVSHGTTDADKKPPLHIVARNSTSKSKQTSSQHALNMNSDSASSSAGSYQSVCVLYSSLDAKWNKIIYDYNGNAMLFGTNANESETNNGLTVVDQTTHNLNRSMEQVNCESETCKNSTVTNIRDFDINFDSINSWKKLLRSVDYIEDEEDMILSESYLLDPKSITKAYSKQNSNRSNIQANIQSLSASTTTIDDDCASDITKSSIHSEKTEDTDLSSNASIISTTPPLSSVVSSGAVAEVKSKRELGFLNKLQYKRFDITKNNSKKDDNVQGLFYKNLNGKTHAESSPPMEIKKLIQTGTLVYGVELDEVEKDDKVSDIPKFVVECIKIIELEENIRTNGIYRASGKKDSIDKLRKKMNESKLRKGTKYVSLKDEDVHTVTGALKQFFRELKTDLIPIEIVKNLPNDLENEENLVKIRDEMNTIDYLPRETLKYLLKHLIRVDQNNEYNLMNASNLSIVWGACIFTSSVSITDTFETSDLLKKNTLFKILIQRYDDIFVDHDRLI